jgi:hypothetical protein
MSHGLQESRVDLVVLTRDDAPLHPDVERGIEVQTGVRVIVHRVIGKPLPGESCRLPAIVRARNEGKHRGSDPWLMFLDDDVVLSPGTVRQLLEGLGARPRFAALGADYLEESKGKVACGHVAMGAALFRRSALNQIKFRWSPGKCECLCCCRDLRRKRMQIGYLPAARARHLDSTQKTRQKGGRSHSAPRTAQNRDSPPHRNADAIAAVASQADGNGGGRAYVLAAFDRRHLQKFQHRFLSSLRAAGNDEPVIAFAYDLYPSERLQLRRLRGVEVIAVPSNGAAVPIRRLLDFQGPLERLASDSVVAYWDAGDVVFQDRLVELWRLARENPQRLLVVAEPFGYPENSVVARWTLSIRDPSARKYAFELLSTRPYFNGGFAAAKVGAMLRYLQGAHGLLHSKALRGTTDWGDQTAMNVYCHSDATRFREIDERWNYCICQRTLKDRRLLPEGRFARDDGRPISVVHGNGGAFIPYAETAPVALARSAGSARFLV